jgi:membrane protease YdiL (CAAX protease family)
MSSEPQPLRDARVAAAIGIVGALSVLAVMPLAFSAMAQMKHGQLPPLPVLAALQVAQGGIVLFLAAWAGLRLGRTLRLDAPLVRRWVGGGPSQVPPRRWYVILPVVGYVLGVLLIQLDRPIAARMPPALQHLPPPGDPFMILACLYGGLAEETLCRLFLVTALARLLVVAKVRPSLAIGAAVVVAAIGFGAGHLPLASALWPMSPIVVLRIVGENALLGVAFGAAFARFGLEAAVVMHIGSDIALHAWPGLDITG